MSLFQRATKKKAKLRIAIDGPAGSGKTRTAMILAENFGKRICVIDTERGSASLYSDLHTFDVYEPESHHPQKYIDAIRAAGKEGYDVIIIDSLSHAWMGKDGALELVDKAAKRSQSGNSFTAWRDVTPLHNELVDTILSAPAHVIVTMRSKMEYVLEENSKGKKTPVKKGMAPIQREGVEYEMTVVCDMDVDHNLIVSKSRIPSIDGFVINKPDAEFAKFFIDWLNDTDQQVLQAETLTPAQSANPPAPAQSVPTVQDAPEGKPVEPVSNTPPSSNQSQDHGTATTAPDAMPSGKPDTSHPQSTDSAHSESASANNPPAPESVWNALYAQAQKVGWSSVDVWRYSETNFGIPLNDVSTKLSTNDARKVFAHLLQLEKQAKAS